MIADFRFSASKSFWINVETDGLEPAWRTDKTRTPNEPANEKTRYKEKHWTSVKAVEELTSRNWLVRAG